MHKYSFIEQTLTSINACTKLISVSKYRIQTVAQLTGLSSALIRAWEARYRLVVPERTDSGYRLYSDEDVAVLLGAQRLVKQGMAPMQIAKLPREQIVSGQRLQLVPGEVSAPEPVVLRDPADEVATKDETNIRQPLSFAERIDQLLIAFANFDRPAADELLAAPLRHMPTEQVCRELLLPLLVEVGERWHRGELTVAAEHFGTTLVRNRLMSLLDGLRRADRTHTVLCACPSGDSHEMGLLLFALEATVQGWEPVYLGPNVPLSDLLHSAQRVRPTLVALSFVMRHDPSELRRLLSEAVTGLRGISPLLVGGSGLRGQSDVVRSTGCLMMPESGRLADLLPFLAKDRTESPRVGKAPASGKTSKKFLR